MKPLLAPRRSISVLLLLLSLLGLAGCGGGNSARTLQQIEVTPTAPSIAAGTQQQFVATAIYSDNTRADVSTSATWNSSNASVATISSTGLATGVTIGSSTITATFESTSGSTSLTVTAATPTGLQVTPTTASTPLGTQQAFQATATFTDGSTQNVTAQVSWTSSNPSIATVSNSAPNNGVATGIGTGSVSIQAAFQNLTANGQLTVTPAVITQLSVSPKTAAIANGTSQQYTAIAIYSDSSMQDVTTSTTWSSSNSTVATISNSAGSVGLAQSTGTGNATIAGNYMGFTDTGSLQVNAAALVSIAVTPTNPSIAKGTTQQFAATGTYTDNSTQDLTTTVTWSSSATGVAAISNAPGSQGLAQSMTVGQTTITATQPNSTISGSTTLTVTAAVVTAVGVTPANASVAKGLSQQYTAIATFSDNSTQTVTTSTTWSSSNTAVATISNASGSSGLASALGQGSVTITGTYSGVSGTATLTVTAAQLTGLTVTPSSPSVANGLTQQFTATGTYTDNSTQNVTTSVTWTSSSTSVATISNASGSQGLAQSQAVGQTTITATAPNSSVAPATATLTVAAATLSRIDVTPSSAMIAKGTNQQYTATAVYTDNSKQNYTSTVTWASSNTSVGQISNSSSTKGLFAAVSQGSATISATDPTSGLSGSTPITVSAATLSSIQITPGNASLAQGFSLQYTATGTYTDGSTQNITSSVTWSPASGGAATVSNASGSQGLATATASGGGNSVVIGAALGSITTTTTLNVTTATLSTIGVSPTNPTVAKGLTQQFTATGTFSDSSTQDLTTQANWTSSSTGVATISNASGSNGLATVAGSSGSTTIAATIVNSANPSPGVSGSTSLTASPAAVSSIAVSPSNPSVPKGNSKAFTATGTFSDGSTADITSTVTWSSSNTATATISNSSGSNGMATTLATGTTTISAAYSGKTGTTILTVTAATLSSISVAPANPSVPAGLQQQFAATGTYSDGSTQTITTSVTWTSTNTNAATISNASGSQGLATTLAAGSATITATDPATGVAGTAMLTVTSATLSSVTVSPNPSSVSSAQTTQLTATGKFSDGTTMDVTAKSTWQSSNTGVATVGASTGVVTGTSPGTCTITATYNGQSATSALTVKQAALQSIVVTPVSNTNDSPKGQVPASFSVPYIATGHYADNSTAIITSNVTWNTVDSSIATVSNSSATIGVVSGVAVGTTQVFASQGNITSPNAQITVTSATLPSGGISVTPKNTKTSRNATLQYTAVATFSDNSTLDITIYNGVTWASSNTNVATINSSTGLATGGVLAGSGLATTTISATEGTVSGSTTLQ